MDGDNSTNREAGASISNKAMGMQGGLDDDIEEAEHISVIPEEEEGEDELDPRSATATKLRLGNVSGLSGPPPDVENGNFNCNDVLGDVDIDHMLKAKVLRDKDGDLVDKKGRLINGRGYRVDSFGNVLNLKDMPIIPKHDMGVDDELPLPLSMHKFNFNANDIMGNLDVDLTPKCPQRDMNKRRINKFNFLASENGHIINRNKRKILDKAYLDKNGDFPTLLNYKGKKFHIKDVTGLLLRDIQTGEPVMKKDKFNSKYWDRKGRQVNKRGYLIDMDGNVVNTKNNKLFDVKGLLKDGEIPKIFSFTKFNQKEVTG
jgi:hypothetical protein